MLVHCFSWVQVIFSFFLSLSDLSHWIWLFIAKDIPWVMIMVASQFQVCHTWVPNLNIFQAGNSILHIILNN